MSVEPSERRSHIAKLKELMRTVGSTRQRRMLRDAIEHVKRSRD